MKWLYTSKVTLTLSLTKLQALKFYRFLENNSDLDEDCQIRARLIMAYPEIPMDIAKF